MKRKNSILSLMLFHRQYIDSVVDMYVENISVRIFFGTITTVGTIPYGHRNNSYLANNSAVTHEA